MRDEELLGRWLADEQAERPDEADARARFVLRALPPLAPGPGFADGVLRAVRERKAAVPEPAGRRWVRQAAAAVLALGSLAAVTAGLIAILPLLARWAIGLGDLAVQAVLWTALAVNGGLDVWSVLAQTSRTAALIVTTPQVSVVLIALEVAGALAVYALHRLIGSERESRR